MKVECECRQLEANITELITKCKELGADFIGEWWQKRLVYDFKPAEKGRWIRLRTNGIKTTLTIKEIKSLQIAGTKELEIEVSSFEDAKAILEKLGYLPRTFQENFRMEYSLNGVNIDIDIWPHIPGYVEIEGEDEQSVLEAIELLGLKYEDFTTLDIDTIYSVKYCIKLDEIKELAFSNAEIVEIEQYKNYRRSN